MRRGREGGVRSLPRWRRSGVAGGRGCARAAAAAVADDLVEPLVQLDLFAAIDRFAGGEQLEEEQLVEPAVQVVELVVGGRHVEVGQQLIARQRAARRPSTGRRTAARTRRPSRRSDSRPLHERLRFAALRDGAVDLGVDLVEGVDHLAEDVLQRVAGAATVLSFTTGCALVSTKPDVDQLIEDLGGLELAEVRQPRDGGDVARAVDEARARAPRVCSSLVGGAGWRRCSTTSGDGSFSRK